MKKNIGQIDKIIRYIIGLSFIIYGIVNQSWIGIIGIIPIASAVIGFCSLYYPFGINTCKEKNSCCEKKRNEKE